MEMTGIDHVKAQFLCIPEGVIADIAGDKGVTAGLHRFLPFTGTGTTAISHFSDGLAAIYITKSMATQFFLYMGEEFRQSGFKVTGAQEGLALDSVDVL